MKALIRFFVFCAKGALPTVALSGVVIGISKMLVDNVDPHVGGAVLVFGLPLAGWFGRYGSEKWW